MEAQINELIEAIVADYAVFVRNFANADESINKFRAGISVKNGKRYIKIIKDGSVWGFIVADDQDKLFRKGDILKAAGWAAPARNKSRGNILDGGYSVSWTGPHYLR